MQRLRLNHVCPHNTDVKMLVEWHVYKDDQSHNGGVIHYRGEFMGEMQLYACIDRPRYLHKLLIRMLKRHGFFDEDDITIDSLQYRENLLYPFLSLGTLRVTPEVALRARQWRLKLTSKDVPRVGCKFIETAYGAGMAVVWTHVHVCNTQKRFCLF